MKNIIKITLLLVIIFTFTIPAFAQEQTSGIKAIEKIQSEKYGASDLGYDTNEDSLDKMRSIRNIVINTILGFIGTFFLILVIWGGYDWMFSGGNEERVTKAKQRIKMAVNGLIIVLVAYILTNFIIDILFKKTIQT
jgi:type IV secretion system pilin